MAHTHTSTGGKKKVAKIMEVGCRREMGKQYSKMACTRGEG